MAQSLTILLAAAALHLSSGVQAAKYSISDTFVGNSFYTGFNAQAIHDPTNGRVKLVSDGLFISTDFY